MRTAIELLADAIATRQALDEEIRKLLPLVEESLAPPQSHASVAVRPALKSPAAAPTEPTPKRKYTKRAKAVAATAAPVAPAAPTPPRAAAAKGKVDRQSPEFRAKLAQKIREGIARKKAAAAGGSADVATPEVKPAPAPATSSSPRHHRGFGSFLAGLKSVKPPKDVAPAIVDDPEGEDE